MKCILNHSIKQSFLGYTLLLFSMSDTLTPKVQQLRKCIKKQRARGAVLQTLEHVIMSACIICS